MVEGATAIGLGRIMAPRCPSSPTPRRILGQCLVRVQLGYQDGRDQSFGRDATEIVGPVVEGATERHRHVDAIDPEEEEAGRRIHRHDIDPLLLHVRQADVRITSAGSHAARLRARWEGNHRLISPAT